MNVAAFYRRGLLGLADSAPVSRFVQSQGWKLGVGRFVAGETLQEALPKLYELERNGLHVNLDLLGEFVDTEAGARAMTREILGTLDQLEGETLEGYMSVKPTQLGLGVSPELALELARCVTERAKSTNAHICLDMENYPFVDGTLALYRSLHDAGLTNVSTVLQSYLHRSMDDLEALLTLDPMPILRIVKGAYRESEDVAYQDKAKVDANFRALVLRGLEAGAKINIATHDEAIITDLAPYLEDADLESDRYEFQLLYGVRPALQKRLARQGHLVRIYVPYGKDWYGYFSRRLAERPANLMFVLRGLFG